MWLTLRSNEQSLPITVPVVFEGRTAIPMQSNRATAPHPIFFSAFGAFCSRTFGIPSLCSFHVHFVVTFLRGALSHCPLQYSFAALSHGIAAHFCGVFQWRHFHETLLEQKMWRF